MQNQQAIHAFTQALEQSLNQALEPDVLKTSLIQAIARELDNSFVFEGIQPQELANDLIKPELVIGFAKEFANDLTIDQKQASTVANQIIQQYMHSFAHTLVHCFAHALVESISSDLVTDEKD